MNQIIDTIIVIKVGTSTLTKRKSNNQLELDLASFRRIGEQVIELQNSGYAVALVSSAAITAGMAATGLAVRPSNTEQSMPTLQALASIGWRHVLNGWADALPGRTIGELLITKQELERDAESSELLKVTHSLMRSGAVAVINENDAITHAEIAYGDNDTLAAQFAAKLKSSKLFGDKVSVVILSDIDGVYKDLNDASSLIKQIDDADHYTDVINAAVSDGGTGGMATKFKAAKIAQSHGVELYIANGRTEHAVVSALQKEVGTHFRSARTIE